jgi:AcrR family transcriptional regulator
MPKRVDHEQRRREIADALLRAARANGLHATGVREVAAEAGVSVRLVQYYFGSKERLLLGGLQRVGELIGERVSERLAAMPPEVNTRDRVEAVLLAILPADAVTRDLYTVHAQYAALALTDSALAAQPYGAGAANLQAEITSMIRTSQERGEMGPERDSGHVALALLALATGLAAAVTTRHSNLPAAVAALREHLNALFAAAGTQALPARSAGLPAAG